MKLLAVAVSVLALAACSQGNSTVSANQTPEGVATAYMESILRHDSDAMKKLVRTGSQAESSWETRSARIQGLQADPKSGTVGFKKRNCSERSAKTVCDFVITTAAGDSWSLAVHVLKDGLKVEDALTGS